MEETNITDPGTGRKIRVSTTARKIYRLLPDYQGVRNVRLNEIIAKEFSNDSSKIFHHFRLTKKGKEIGEIRGDAGFYYVSAIRDGYIDILTVQGKFFEPKYRVKEQEKISLED